MHLPAVRAEDSFEATADGRPVPPSSLLPDWSAHDRFGVVVHEPFGTLGASRLVQLAISCFCTATTAPWTSGRRARRSW